MLTLLMVASMLLSSTALAAEDGSAAHQNEDYIFISETDAAKEAVSFQLSEEALAAVSAEGAAVQWKLQRVASYANPGEDDEIHPLYGETDFYPNEKDSMELSELKYNTFGIANIESTLNGSTLTLSFDVNPLSSRGNVSVPHSNGGAYLDVCGIFALEAYVGGEEIALGKTVTVEVKPYASFHTMWEIYDALDELAELGDDDASTAKPYVVQNVMGRSTSGYEMPYLIIAKSSAAVENWLDLCERAETEPEAVQSEIEAGTLEYQVPVMYSNIHANEAAATDAVMEFAKLLMTEDEIPYTKLTGLTETGKAKLDEQREALGLHIPELVADKTSYLGAILPETNDLTRGVQNSGKVKDFDSYYEQEDVTINVDKLLDGVFFLLVPEENVEGRIYVTRTSSGGYDLNRDNSFQTLPETQNMQHLIATFNPVTLVEFHGQVTSYQFEPCSPPHEPNFEYDLLSEHLMTGGEAMGAAAVANNPDWQSYVIPMRDYLTSDEEGNAFWQYPWDDMSTSYTPQFAMLQGCVSYTVEMPAYSESGRIADTYGMIGLSDYVAAEKESYFMDQLEIYKRCVNNENTDAEVGAWLVDAADTKGAEAALFRPAYDGADENGQFFPECYIIPLDSAHQTNLQAAYDMIEWLTRNDVKVGITDSAITFKGVTYPAGTMIVSMYQAKRAVANGALYDGTLIRNWTDLYSEGITAFNFTRGFDMIACAEPAAYETIAAAVGTMLDNENSAAYLADNAKSQFIGLLNADVIIVNASEDSTAAVNALLQAGKTVGMVTDGAYKGSFICSYKDYASIESDYVLTAIGLDGRDISAQKISKAPTVYISGTANVLTPSKSGYVYTSRVTSASYNYDRMAMDMLNFQTTTDASAADAVIGATKLDASGLAAVQNGAVYVGYTSSAVKEVNSKLVAVGTESTSGMDCLGYVVYPNETLVNASYIAEGDNVLYGYGTTYFTELPEGATVLVQRNGSEPMEGFLNGDDESYNNFINGVMGFSYEGKDKNGNDVNITLFANTMTNKAHQRDEYAYISNAIFAGLLSDEQYESAYVSGSSGSSGSSSGSSSTKDDTSKLSFTDVPADAYYADAVKWAVEKNITSGITAATFAPNAVCTCAQAVTFLWRAAGSPAPKGSAASFTDVAADAFYHDAVLWAVENGITTGTTDTTFSPNATCTRGQIVTFLYRNAQAQGDGVTGAWTNPFVDVALDSYCGEAVMWAIAGGITNGTSDSTFSPNSDCTRAQIVTFLYRSQNEG